MFEKLVHAFNPAKPPPRFAYPRAHQRVVTSGLACPLGRIKDMSAGGVRVRCDEKPTFERGSALDVVVSGENQKLHLRGVVVWIKRVERRAYEFGLRWTGVSPVEAKVIEQFAHHGYVSQEFVKGVQAEARSGGAKAGASGGGQRGEARGAPGAAEPMIELDDLYAIVGAERGATQEQIAEAYRRRASELHPDHNSAPDATESFALLGKAYSVLRDPGLRRRYDEMTKRFAPDRKSA